MIQVSQRRR